MKKHLLICCSEATIKIKNNFPAYLRSSQSAFLSSTGTFRPLGCCPDFEETAIISQRRHVPKGQACAVVCVNLIHEGQTLRNVQQQHTRCVCMHSLVWFGAELMQMLHNLSDTSASVQETFNMYIISYMYIYYYIRLTFNPSVSVELTFTCSFKVQSWSDRLSRQFWLPCKRLCV